MMLQHELTWINMIQLYTTHLGTDLDDDLDVDCIGLW